MPSNSREPAFGARARAASREASGFASSNAHTRTSSLKVTSRRVVAFGMDWSNCKARAREVVRPSRMELLVSSRSATSTGKALFPGSSASMARLKTAIGRGLPSSRITKSLMPRSVTGSPDLRPTFTTT